MSRPSRIFLIVIVYAAILAMYVFVRNTRNNDVNHPLANSVNYLDIQMEIHHRMYVLILDIDERYQNSPEDIKMLVDYVERLHEEAIILGSSNSNRLAKIITCAEDPESLRWAHEQLIWVVQPLDEVGDSRDAKITILIMNMETEYLHESLRFLVGDNTEEAMAKVEDFKKKFKK